MSKFVKIQNVLHLIMIAMSTVGVVLAVQDRSVLSAFVACLAFLAIVNGLLCVQVIHLLEMDQNASTVP